MPGPHSKFLLVTRIGFAARGLMYILVAWLTLRLGRGEDAGPALAYLQTGAGKAVLAAMARGFGAYGAWRLLDEGLDMEQRGTGPKALIVRLSHAGSGLIHLWLGFKTAKLALGGHAQGGSSEAAENGAAVAIAFPSGHVLLLAAAAIVLCVAIAQLSHAIRLSFLKHLTPEARRKWWVKVAGAGGYAARGIIFAMAAWLLYRAAIDRSPAEAGGLGDALTNLNDAIRNGVAAGLALFGSYSLIEAWFRILKDPQVKARVKEALP